MAAIGWYGPLIDLSRASSHLDDFVQLLVFVRRSQPIQKYNASKGGISFQVGDDTRSYFSVSLWQKHMGTTVVPGDVIFLQNVKIAKFRNALEATTVQISELIILVHSYELTSSIGTDELVAHCRLGETTREKLRRVISWVQHTESTFQHIQHKKMQPLKNWKEHEEKKLQNCQSISEVLRLTTSCNADFFACIREIVLPLTWKPNEVEEPMFVSKRLFMMADNKILEDLICTGCKLCGFPISCRCELKQDKTSLYCHKNFKYFHDVCLIYKPFLLYVWDEAGQIPLLVKNKAAEIMFGNITAENVYKCYREEQKNQIPYHGHDREPRHSTPSSTSHPVVQKSVAPALGNHQLRCQGSSSRRRLDFHRIWLILIKALLQHGKNSPFRFEIAVEREKDLENGRFELVSLVMPCFGAGGS